MNNMKKIAELLGVELGEEFKVRLTQTPEIINSEIFVLREHGLETDDCIQRSDILANLLTGTYEIVKLPWKPKGGDSYWYYSEFYILEKSVWDGALFDLALYKLGKIYRTREEAEAHAAEDASYWNEIRKEIEE